MEVTYLGGGLGTAISGCIANLLTSVFIFKTTMFPAAKDHTNSLINNSDVKEFFVIKLLLIISMTAIVINSCHTVIMVAMEKHACYWPNIGVDVVQGVCFIMGNAFFK